MSSNFNLNQPESDEPMDLRQRQIEISEARSHSVVSNSEFLQTALGSAALNMRNSLVVLKSNCPDSERKIFDAEMDDFYVLFTRYLEEKSQKVNLDWSKISSPADSQVIPYSSLPSLEKSKVAPMLSKLAVLKLNGGLGTTMGCVGPKSAIEVRDGNTFLDLIVRQIEVSLY